MMRVTRTSTLKKIDLNSLLKDRITIKDLKHEDVLEKLEDLLHSIPITDLRYKLSNVILGEDVLEDLVLSSEVRTSRKDITTGILDIVINFVDNLDEIERHELDVSVSNEILLENNIDGVLFDPIHGRLSKTEDHLKSYADIRTDRSLLSYKSHLLLRYQLLVIGDNFRLGYVVYDHLGSIIYYNENESPNLIELVYRSVQEIWGYPGYDNMATGKELIEGIEYLINGRKLSICTRENNLPSFIEGSFKGIGKVNEIRGEKYIYHFLVGFVGTFLPLVLLVGYFVGFLLSIRFMSRESYEIDLFYRSFISSGGMRSLIYLLLESFLKVPVLLCFSGLIVTIFSRKFTQYLDRIHSRFINRNKLL